ncbi:GNAT family N-acetyltransferase [Microbacterium sp. CPCC 204701]|uniref:GNAT family N-acetyltransferase n=1 Tax=Microbacterium sp. CPCC 204701 TaxID=2493084 RepID=UPI000FD87E9C|nr:GNAT family N-acetyltransferase [Microbacterium sp. CPCC 204701]
MRARDLAVVEATADDIERWKRLSDRALEPNPFVDPRFVMPSARLHFMGAGQRAIFVEDDDELHLVLLYTVQQRRVTGVRVKTVTTAETIAAFEGERFHPLVSPANPIAAATTLLQELPRLTKQGVFELDRLPAGGALEEAFDAAIRGAGLPCLDTDERRFATFDAEGRDVPIAERVEVRSEHLSTRTRKGHRRRLAGLARELTGDLSFEDVVDDSASIDEYLALQASGWKGDVEKDGKAFEVTQLDTWFREVSHAFRDDGRLSVYRLGTADETIYMTVVLRAGNGAFGFHDAYNEAYAKHSPGTIGRLLEMELAATTNGSTYFDPSMDDAKYPTSAGLYPDARTYRSRLIGLRGAPKLLVGVAARRSR